MAAKSVASASLASSEFSSTKDGPNESNNDNTDANDSDSLKERGNLAVKLGQVEQGIACYTQAILNAENNDSFKKHQHIYYSNRSAAYLLQGLSEKALEDAITCLELSSRNNDNPSKGVVVGVGFAKGYSRKGAALHALDRLVESMMAYEEGLVKHPGNELLQSGLKKVTKDYWDKKNPGNVKVPVLEKVVESDQDDADDSSEVGDKAAIHEEKDGYDASKEDYSSHSSDGHRNNNDDVEEELDAVLKPPDDFLNHLKEENRKRLAAAAEIERNDQSSPPEEEQKELHDEHNSQEQQSHINNLREKQETIVSQIFDAGDTKFNSYDDDNDSSFSKAESWKQKGLIALQLNNPVNAIKYFSQAIDLSEDHSQNVYVYYSNRSAAHILNGDYTRSLMDAINCLHINPDYSKGYARKGMALCAAERWDASVDAYEEGLKRFPDDKVLLEGLKNVIEARDKASAVDIEEKTKVEKGLSEELNNDTVDKASDCEFGCGIASGASLPPLQQHERDFLRGAELDEGDKNAKKAPILSPEQESTALACKKEVEQSDASVSTMTESINTSLSMNTWATNTEHASRHYPTTSILDTAAVVQAARRTSKAMPKAAPSSLPLPAMVSLPTVEYQYPYYTEHHAKSNQQHQHQYYSQTISNTNINSETKPTSMTAAAMASRHRQQAQYRQGQLQQNSKEDGFFFDPRYSYQPHEHSNPQQKFQYKPAPIVNAPPVSPTNIPHYQPREHSNPQQKYQHKPAVVAAVPPAPTTKKSHYQSHEHSNPQQKYQYKPAPVVRVPPAPTTKKPHYQPLPQQIHKQQQILNKQQPQRQQNRDGILRNSSERARLVKIDAAMTTRLTNSTDNNNELPASKLQQNHQQYHEQDQQEEPIEEKIPMIDEASTVSNSSDGHNNNLSRNNGSGSGNCVRLLLTATVEWWVDLPRCGKAFMLVLFFIAGATAANVVVFLGPLASNSSSAATTSNGGTAGSISIKDAPSSLSNTTGGEPPVQPITTEGQSGGTIFINSRPTNVPTSAIDSNKPPLNTPLPSSSMENTLDNEGATTSTTTVTSLSPSLLPTTAAPVKQDLFFNLLPTPLPTAIPILPEPSTSVPIVDPTERPTRKPKTNFQELPTRRPQSTSRPTKVPTTQKPTKVPTTQKPTKMPTTQKPTKQPTTKRPTDRPHPKPTPKPSPAPTTEKPTHKPTRQPQSQYPTRKPVTPKPILPDETASPSPPPTIRPTYNPTPRPTRTPSSKPTIRPTENPTNQPTPQPTTEAPTSTPTITPSTALPSPEPTKVPTTSKPTLSPTLNPSTMNPTEMPSTSMPITEMPIYNDLSTWLPSSLPPSRAPPINNRPSKSNKPSNGGGLFQPTKDTASPSSYIPSSYVPTVDRW
eukprot:CAMPEP_0194368058 /NCGR_PEP_ID=MMETSP0174-20130528/16260_1 /TAXON_ID=216777 /ORGANISM="Proboscia alata, Strain PI-D3" /LENGTH=1373 /DNA_ID=CAMNT_0039144211 /DNA_START=66 /DNA_END=4184 /DNA_ORIENTATION=+